MDDLEIIFGGTLPEKQPFQVTDVQTATWAVNTALKAEGNIQKAEMDKAAMLLLAKEKIEAWFTKETAEDRNTVERMMGFLEPWVREKIKGKRTKSVAVIGATVGLRKTPGRVEVTDLAKLEAWQAAHPDIHVIERKPQPMKVEIRKAVESTGEVPDGVELIDGTEVLYVKGGEE